MGLTCIFVHVELFTGSRPSGARPSGARPSGARHWKAKLTDGQVEQMRVLREDHGWSYGRLAKHFQCTRACAQMICSYRRR